jgi:hypothetical protein
LDDGPALVAIDQLEIQGDVVGDAGVEAGIEGFLAIAHSYGLVSAQHQGPAIEHEAIALAEGPGADHFKAP